jgi:protein Mpv17
MKRSCALLNLLPLLGYSALTVSAFSGDFHLFHSNLQQLPALQNAVESLPQSWIGQATTSTLASSDIVADTIVPAYQSYREALRENPLQTKVVTGAVLAVVGDAIAQTREPAEYNSKRAAAFVAFDACYRAVQQWTYPPLMVACKGQYLAGMLASLGFAPTYSDDTVYLMAAFEQTMISQLVIIPLFYYPVFYAITGAVQGLSVDESIQRAKDTFVPLMKRNLAFWIPVQFGVFGYVEENLQIPILIACGLVWTVILSVSAGAVAAPAKEVATALLEDEIILAMDSSNGKTADSFFNNPAAVQEIESPLGRELQNATTVLNTN